MHSSTSSIRTSVWSAFLACVALSAFTGTVAEAQPLRFLIPLYSYPCDGPCGPPFNDEGIAFYEKAAFSQSFGVETTVIVNPNSGEFSAPNSDFIGALRILQGAGVEMVGYVPTGYADRAESSVRAVIDAYVEHYGDFVTGMFFDEGSPDVADIGYNNRICAYAESRGLGMTVLNPGLVPEAASWSTTCDVVVLFENPYEGLFRSSGQYIEGTSWDDHVLPDRLRALGSDRLATIVHTATRAEMEAVVAESAEAGYGHVYVTDDELDNPYNVGPGYWSQEVVAVAATTVGAEDGSLEGAPRLAVRVLNPTTGGVRSLAVRTASRTDARITAYDRLGRRVLVVFEGGLAAGETRLPLQMGGLAPGVYVVLVDSSTVGSASVLITVLD